MTFRELCVRVDVTSRVEDLPEAVQPGSTHCRQSSPTILRPEVECAVVVNPTCFAGRRVPARYRGRAVHALIKGAAGQVLLLQPPRVVAKVRFPRRSGATGRQRRHEEEGSNENSSHTSPDTSWTEMCQGVVSSCCVRDTLRTRLQGGRTDRRLRDLSTSTGHVGRIGRGQQSWVERSGVARSDQLSPGRHPKFSSVLATELGQGLVSDLVRRFGHSRSSSE